MLDRLPKSLRMRFFSVKEYAICDQPLSVSEASPKNGSEPISGAAWQTIIGSEPISGPVPNERKRDGRPPDAIRQPSISVLRAGARVSRLLDLRGSAGVVQLLLDRLGVGLRDALLDHRGHTLNEVLGFLEPEAGDLADDLDHADL